MRKRQKSNKEQGTRSKDEKFPSNNGKKVSAVKKKKTWFGSSYSTFCTLTLFFPVSRQSQSNLSVLLLLLLCFFCCCPCIQGGGSPKSLAVKQAAKRVDCWEKELAKVQTGKRTRVSGPCCVCCRTGASNDSNNNKEIKGNVVVVVVERR